MANMNSGVGIPLPYNLQNNFPSGSRIGIHANQKIVVLQEFVLLNNSGNPQEMLSELAPWLKKFTSVILIKRLERKLNSESQIECFAPSKVNSPFLSVNM